MDFGFVKSTLSAAYHNVAPKNAGPELLPRRSFLRRARCCGLFPKFRGTLLALYQRDAPIPRRANPYPQQFYRWLHISRLPIWSTKLNFGARKRASCSRSEFLQLRMAARTFMLTTSKESPRSLRNQNTLHRALRQSHSQKIRNVLLLLFISDRRASSAGLENAIPA